MKNKEAVTYENIIIEPYEFVHIEELEIKREINEHGSLKITGNIKEEIRDRYIEECDFGTEIIIKERRKDTESIIFVGIINAIQIKEEGELYFIEIMAYSKTFLMDIQKKKRSFQDINMSYADLIKMITQEYQQGQVYLDSVLKQPIGKFLVQYEETDWEFIKRLASHFNEGLYPEINAAFLTYSVGIPRLIADSEIEEDSYCISKDIGEYAVSSGNDRKDIMDMDFITYKIQSYSQFHLGEKVIFKKIPFYIKSVNMTIKNAVLIKEYGLCSKAGLKKDMFYNKKLQGISILGYVLEVKRDKIRVHIEEIDKKQEKEKAYWFSYSTVYSSKDGSGWYCMPEVGDKVRIQFPTEREEEAYAISSVSDYRPNSDSEDRMKDYRRRYIRNPQGMEVVWTPEQVIISANGKCMAILDENGTVQIHADSKLVISSEENIDISAGNKIDIYATDNINIKCGNKAEINLNKNGITELKGNKVYTN